MKRLNFNELSSSRIIEALQRRVINLPHLIYWNINLTNKLKINSYKNIHIEDRCFLIANGPSLINTDLSKLKNEITIGLNRIYLLDQKINFGLDYFVSVNELVIEQFKEDIENLNIPKFLNWNRRYLFNENKKNNNFINLSLGFSDKFSDNPIKCLYSGGTVTFVALQIAYFLGFKEVIIIGLDHYFEDKGIPNKTETRKSEKDLNHFDPNYFPKGSKWQLPDLRRSEIAYKLANDFYNKNGRKIYDATVNGHCNIFEKVNYDDLFI